MFLLYLLQNIYDSGKISYVVLMNKFATKWYTHCKRFSPNLSGVSQYFVIT